MIKVWSVSNFTQIIHIVLTLCFLSILKDAVQRVKELQEEGKLTGVMDDRGKFIYITMEELESVAKFIKQHGRVSISDLAESSNRLINLNPDNAETQKKLLSETSG